jgi:hypothetical protein
LFFHGCIHGWVYCLVGAFFVDIGWLLHGMPCGQCR